MKKEIENLIKLQEIDIEIRKIDLERSKLPEAFNRLSEEIKKMKEEIAKDREFLLELQKKKIDIEDEISLENARLAKSQQKLSSIKTNREYQALLKEIEEMKKGNKAREDEILDLMAKNEEISKRIEEKEAKINDLALRFQEEKANMEQKNSQYDERYNYLMAERDKVSKDIRKDILSKYNFLREKRGGIAIVEVKNAVCTGCNMNVPAQLFNELLRSDKIYFCPSCQRLIYTSFENNNNNQESSGV